MAKSFILSQQDRPAPLNAGGFMITVLASKAETDGYELFHQSGAEGKGPGPHFHPWDETFVVLSGEVHCGVDGKESLATPGTVMHVPGGSVHWFRFGKGGAAVLALTSHGNASDMFTEYHSGINWDSVDRAELIAVAARHGQTVL
jgi:quercetin dioxygenase-like cupin family protein